MEYKSRKSVSFAVVVIVLLGLVLACGTSSVSPDTSGNTSLQETMVALSIAETMVAMQLTQVADNSQSQPVDQPAVQEPAAQPTVQAPVVQPTEETVPTQDMTSLIQNANILLYEDTYTIGSWVFDTIRAMGLKATYDGDAIGHFMEHLNSGTKWDLIIVASEHHSKVQGEIWDVIGEAIHRDHKPALIAEMWYLDSISEGRIKVLTTECGVEWQKDIPSATSIFWLAPDSPFASHPVAVPSLTGPGGYWEDAGDEVSLIAGSGAELLAGTQAGDHSNHGVLVSCFDGRVVLQTFCNHDFGRATIQPLWKNLITNTLEAHFRAIQ
ncbi:MAG: hypothetical protein JW704_11395 [Anaerolineaceae bacterium]|nr:hypothetical protein [Anaerolineaceae bacterium]MBN2676873.1 hypothetical protein [Anaerolineaceae bacterium]